MDIRDYKTFKDDSTKELQYVIKKYNLSYSEHLILKYKESNEETAFFSNSFCALKISWLEFFPRIIVSTEFFLLNDLDEIKIDHQKIFNFLDIDEDEYYRFLISFNNDSQSTNNYTIRDIILKQLNEINIIIIKFYDDIFNGKKTYNDYKKKI